MSEAEACARCGALAPLLASAGRRLCVECRQRLAEALVAGPPGVATLLRASAGLTRRVGGRAMLVSAVVAVPVVASAAVGPGSLAAHMLIEAWSLLATGAVIGLGLDALSGAEPPGLWRAVRRAVRVWPALLLTGILQLGAILVASLALLVPGVVVALGTAPSLTMVVRGEPAGLPALRRAMGRTRGHRLALLGAALALAPLVFLVVLAGGTVAVVLVGLATGAGNDDVSVLARAVAALLARVATVPFVLLVVALDAMLPVEPGGTGSGAVGGG